MTQYKMFWFIKQALFVAMTFFSCNGLECVSMNNQKSKAKTTSVEWFQELMKQDT